MIIDTALSTDTILEFNANGFRRGIHDYPDGKRFMYPHKAFWEKVSGSHVRVIVGSDCHNPAQVWDDCLPDSHSYLAALGISPLEIFEHSRTSAPRFIPGQTIAPMAWGCEAPCSIKPTSLPLLL